MKIRKGVRRSTRAKKTHEEQAIDDVFGDDGDFTVSLEEAEDLTVNGFEAVDYNLDVEASKKEWERIGEEVAKSTTQLLISVAAFLDGVKSAEEHVNDAFDTKFDALTREALDQIEQALNLKIKDLLLAHLDLSPEAHKAMLIRFALQKGGGNMDAFKKFLSDIAETTGEENPYGSSLTKQFKREF